MKSRKTRMLVALGLVAISGFSLMIASAATDVKVITTDLKNAIQRIPRVQIVSTDYAKKATLSNANHLLRINTETNSFVLGDKNSKAGGTSSSVLGGDTNKITSSNNSTIIAGSNNEINSSHLAVILGGEGNSIKGTSNEGVVVGGSNNKITKKGVDGVIVGGANNEIASSTNNNITNNVILGSGNKVIKSNSVALGEKSINQGASSFLWTDSNNVGTLSQDNVFAVVADHGMVVNKDMPHSFAKLTIGESLTITKSSLNPSCTNGNNKGVLKVVDNTSNPNVSCFCACDGYNWVSLFGAGMCNSSCKTSITPKCDNSKVTKICPSAGQYEYVGECIEGEVVTGTGAYLVEEDGTVHWTCQTNNGAINDKCKTKNIVQSGNCNHDDIVYECAGEFDNAYFLTGLAANLTWSDDLNSKLFNTEPEVSGTKCAWVCKPEYHIKGNQCVENKPCVADPDFSGYNVPALGHGASTGVSKSFDVPEGRKTCTATVSCSDSELSITGESCSLTEHCQATGIDNYYIPALNLWTYTSVNKTGSVVVGGKTEGYYSCNRDAYCNAGNPILTGTESCTYGCYSVTKSGYTIEALNDGVTVTRRGNTGAIEGGTRICEIQATCKSGAVILSGETCRNEMNPCPPQTVGKYTTTEPWAHGDTGWVYRSGEGEAAGFSGGCQRLAQCLSGNIHLLGTTDNNCNFMCGGSTPSGAGVKTGNGNFTSETYTPKTWSFTGGTLYSCLWKCDSGYERDGNGCKPISYSCTDPQPGSHTRKSTAAPTSNKSWEYVENTSATLSACQWTCPDNTYKREGMDCVPKGSGDYSCGGAPNSCGDEVTPTGTGPAVDNEYDWYCGALECGMCTDGTVVPTANLHNGYCSKNAVFSIRCGGNRADINFEINANPTTNNSTFYGVDLELYYRYHCGNDLTPKYITVHKTYDGNASNPLDGKGLCGDYIIEYTAISSINPSVRSGYNLESSGEACGGDDFEAICIDPQPGSHTRKSTATPTSNKSWEYVANTSATLSACQWTCPDNTYKREGMDCVPKGSGDYSCGGAPNSCGDEVTPTGTGPAVDNEYDWYCGTLECGMCTDGTPVPTADLHNGYCAGGDYTLYFVGSSRCNGINCAASLYLTVKDDSTNSVVALPDSLDMEYSFKINQGGDFGDTFTLSEGDVYNGTEVHNNPASNGGNYTSVRFAEGGGSVLTIGNRTYEIVFSQSSYGGLCVGDVPENATFVEGSNQGLDSDTTRVLYANEASVPTNAKCAYYCPSGYEKNGNKCDKISYSCAGTLPVGAKLNTGAAPSSNTSYFYSTATVPCAFQCENSRWDGSRCVIDINVSCYYQQESMNGTNTNLCGGPAWMKTTYSTNRPTPVTLNIHEDLKYHATLKYEEYPSCVYTNLLDRDNDFVISAGSTSATANGTVWDGGDVTAWDQRRGYQNYYEFDGNYRLDIPSEPIYNMEGSREITVGGRVYKITKQPCTYGSDIRYLCIGTVPENAAFLTGSDQVLTSDTTRTLYADIGAAAGKKCAYYCPSGYEKDGNSCKQKAVCGSGGAVNGYSYKVPTSSFCTIGSLSGSVSTKSTMTPKYSWVCSNGGTPVNCNAAAPYAIIGIAQTSFSEGSQKLWIRYSVSPTPSTGSSVFAGIITQFRASGVCSNGTSFNGVTLNLNAAWNGNQSRLEYYNKPNVCGGGDIQSISALELIDVRNAGGTSNKLSNGYFLFVGDSTGPSASCTGERPGENTKKSATNPTSDKGWTYVSDTNATLAACEWTCQDSTYKRDGTSMNCKPKESGDYSCGGAPNSCGDEVTPTGTGAAVDNEYDWYCGTLECGMCTDGTPVPTANLHNGYCAVSNSPCITLDNVEYAHGWVGPLFPSNEAEVCSPFGARCENGTFYKQGAGYAINGWTTCTTIASSPCGSATGSSNPRINAAKPYLCNTSAGWSLDNGSELVRYERSRNYVPYYNWKCKKGTVIEECNALNINSRPLVVERRISGNQTSFWVETSPAWNNYQVINSDFVTLMRTNCGYHTANNGGEFGPGSQQNRGLPECLNGEVTEIKLVNFSPVLYNDNILYPSFRNMGTLLDSVGWWNDESGDLKH